MPGALSGSSGSAPARRRESPRLWWGHGFHRLDDVLLAEPDGAGHVPGHHLGSLRPDRPRHRLGDVVAPAAARLARSAHDGHRVSGTTCLRVTRPLAVWLATRRSSLSAASVGVEMPHEAQASLPGGGGTWPVVVLWPSPSPPPFGRVALRVEQAPHVRVGRHAFGNRTGRTRRDLRHTYVRPARGRSRRSVPPLAAPAAQVAPADVLTVGHRLQVVRVDAEGDQALVVDGQPGRDRPSEQDPGDPVRVVDTALISHPAVTVGTPLPPGSRPDPDPAVAPLDEGGLSQEPLPIDAGRDAGP